jgi:hypothetical protein
MKKCLALLIIIALATASCKKTETTPENQFQVSALTAAYKILKTSDNNLLVFGSLYGYPAVAKITSSGDVIFQKQFLTAPTGRIVGAVEINSGYVLASQSADNLCMIKMDINGFDVGHTLITGSFIIGGITHNGNSSFVTGRTASTSPHNLFVASFNGNADLVRMMEYPSTADDGGMAITCKQDSLYVLAYTYAGGHGDRDFWLIKMNGNLDSIYSKTYGCSTYDEPDDILVSSDNYLLMAGHTTVSDPLHNGRLYKTDLQGNIIFEKEYGADMHDGFQCVTELPNGSYAMGGYSSVVMGQETAFMVVTDNQGANERSFRFGGRSNNRIYSLAEINGTLYGAGIATRDSVVQAKIFHQTY